VNTVIINGVTYIPKVDKDVFRRNLVDLLNRLTYYANAPSDNERTKGMADAYYTAAKALESILDNYVEMK